MYQIFGFLIIAARSIQKQVEVSRESSRAGVANNNRSDVFFESYNRSGDDLLFLSRSSSIAAGGLSEATRLELQAVLTMTSTIRNVESVEIEFARTCTQRLARLVHNIEIETFQYLAECYDDFYDSISYFELMSLVRCSESTNITGYSKLQSLFQGVKHTILATNLKQNLCFDINV